jgi:hypothetical protein
MRGRARLVKRPQDEGRDLRISPWAALWRM